MENEEIDKTEGTTDESNSHEILEQLMTKENDGKRSLAFNVKVLDWYFNTREFILNDSEKDKIFSLMTYASIEDPYCFMRVLLYIANTRRTDREEIAYKIMVHFLATMFPEFVMANLDLFTGLGRKDDVLYFMQCSSISERVASWIKHMSKTDDDFKMLMEGSVIGKNIERKIRYRPKFGKNRKWDVFLFKILDDPTLNGITL
jgi:hypothetical protein